MEYMRKSFKTCWDALQRRGYWVDSYEPNTLEAHFMACGVCIRSKKLYFSPKGRCIRVEERNY